MTPSTQATIERARHSAGDSRRLRHSTLGISLGFGGAGSAWSLAHLYFGAPAFISEILLGASMLWWLIVTAARAPLTPRRFAYLRDDFRNPSDGPLLAYIPIIALLLTSHYGPHLGSTAQSALSLGFVALLSLVCARLLAVWLSGEMQLEHIHPGYALPVIAGPFIASMTLTAAGFPSLAVGAIAVGGFYWLSMGTIIFLRLLHGPNLPRPLKPTLAVLVTPPVTAGLAWFSLRNGILDAVQQGLAGIIVLLLLMQIFLASRYLRGGFHIGWWALAFPTGALASYAIRWAISSQSSTSDVIAWIALAFSAILLIALMVCTMLSARRPSTQAAQQE